MDSRFISPAELMQRRLEQERERLPESFRSDVPEQALSAKVPSVRRERSLVGLTIPDRLHY